jgi:hypothetical protein
MLIFISHLSFAFCQVILWIVLVTQLSAVSYVGSLVSCYNFRSLRLSCRKWTKYESALFRSESVSLRVDSLYAEEVEAVKALAAFQLLLQYRFVSEAELKQRLGFETSPSV